MLSSALESLTAFIDTFLLKFNIFYLKQQLHFFIAAVTKKICISIKNNDIKNKQLCNVEI